MKETGNRPPMMVPAKGLYMAKDLARNAAYFSVPIKPIEVCYTANSVIFTLCLAITKPDCIYI
jgi:hypothetical protein